MTTDRFAALRAALEADVTARQPVPGWQQARRFLRAQDCEYLTACDPDTIRALLAERDAWKASAKEAEALLREAVITTSPGERANG